MNDIESETSFKLKFLKEILLLPFTLIMVLFRKKEFSEVFEPVRMSIKYFFEPKFTATIFLTNIIIFGLSIFFFPENLFDMLVNYPSDLLNPARFYSFLTAGFLHADLGHLVANMLGLLIFGRVVERSIGTGKTIFVYFSALIISGIISAAVNLFVLGVDTGGIGASGALMGLVSAAILLDPFFLTYDLIFPIPIMVYGWLAIYADVTGVLSPTNDGIGHFAHLGGFASIAFIMLFFDYGEKEKIKKGFIINIASLIFALIVYFIYQNKLYVSVLGFFGL